MWVTKIASKQMFHQKLAKQLKSLGPKNPGNLFEVLFRNLPIRHLFDNKPNLLLDLIQSQEQDLPNMLKAILGYDKILDSIAKNISCRNKALAFCNEASQNLPDIARKDILHMREALYEKGRQYDALHLTPPVKGMILGGLAFGGTFALMLFLSPTWLPLATATIFTEILTITFSIAVGALVGRYVEQTIYPAEKETSIGASASLTDSPKPGILVGAATPDKGQENINSQGATNSILALLSKSSSEQTHLGTDGNMNSQSSQYAPLNKPPLDDQHKQFDVKEGVSKLPTP